MSVSQDTAALVAKSSGDETAMALQRCVSRLAATVADLCGMLAEQDDREDSAASAAVEVEPSVPLAKILRGRKPKAKRG